MARFAFPVPGRKKAPPQVTVTAPPTSKAQKILGSTALNIDSPKIWEDTSRSGMSISYSESTLTTSYASTTRGYPQHGRGIARSEREWGDESEVIPHHLRANGFHDEEDDYRTDMSNTLRKRQSSSTLVSWYDKTKQPLSISQQTSASAMAKGLPTKAHKMLDVSNDQLVEKSKKKKPSKLDLSHLMSRSRGSKKQQQPQQTPQHWEAPLLAPDHITKSPSIMSEFASPPLRKRISGRLRKQPTQESLRSLRSMQSEPARPATSNSYRRGQHHLNGLPNLYEHYEQMSFRQIMEGYEEVEEEPKQSPVEAIPPPARISQLPKPVDHLQLPGHHDERIISQYAHRTLPQTPQSSSSKLEQGSPTDCAASVSSRHTRTSKASKRTDQSFQDSDLLEKSILSLSSDSEEDAYVDNGLRSPASVTGRRPSDADSTSEARPSTSHTNKSVERRLSVSSKGSMRISYGPSRTHLAIPKSHSNKLPTIRDRSSSLSRNSINTIPEVGIPHKRSLSRVSIVSNSTINTTMTWQSKPGFGVQEARAITMLPVLGPTDVESETDELAEANGRYLPEGLANSADQPTPPLSPSSVDFYIRSAHSSIDGHGSQNRFMAVTRQEEMLLAALRHKRQLMRETILSESEEIKEKRHVKGHRSKPSEATITESTFDDFDFPAPPTCKDRTTVTPNGTTVIDLRTSLGQSQPQPGNQPAREFEETKIASPTPTRPSSSRLILNKANRESSDVDDGHERILLYLDRPIAQELHFEEREPSPDLSDFMEFDEGSSDSEIVSEVIMYAEETSPNDRSSRYGKAQSGRSSMMSYNTKSYRASATTITEEDGIPRPDSPISPEGLGAPPPRKTANVKKTARLSAVGPVRWGNED